MICAPRAWLRVADFCTVRPLYINKKSQTGNLGTGRRLAILECHKIKNVECCGKMVSRFLNGTVDSHSMSSVDVTFVDDSDISTSG